MRLAIPVLVVLLLQGCSTIQDWVGLPANSDDECSLDSVPICIPIGGQHMKMEGDNFTMLDIDVGHGFTVSDFKCKCGCGEVAYTPKLVETLADLRRKFGRDVVVTSGYRCEDRNREVGGIEGSLHTEGRAVDFVVRGVSPAKVVQYLSDFDGGVGEYERHVHIDSGDKKYWRGSYASSQG
jgi:hypothetical protein